MRETVTHVYFWGGPLSQWFRADFDECLNPGEPVRAFSSAEQYMMAAKACLFEDAQTLEQILAIRDARKIKALGRLVRGFDRATWTAAIPQILLRANFAKFDQNATLAAYLLSTHAKRLVEASPVDCIYGAGLHYDDPRIESEADWPGSNLLGNQLEIVRARLAAGPSGPSAPSRPEPSR